MKYKRYVIFLRAAENLGHSGDHICPFYQAGYFMQPLTNMNIAILLCYFCGMAYDIPFRQQSYKKNYSVWASGVGTDMKRLNRFL